MPSLMEFHLFQTCRRVACPRIEADKSAGEQKSRKQAIKATWGRGTLARPMPSEAACSSAHLATCTASPNKWDTVTPHSRECVPSSQRLLA